MVSLASVVCHCDQLTCYACKKVKFLVGRALAAVIKSLFTSKSARIVDHMGHGVLRC